MAKERTVPRGWETYRFAAVAEKFHLPPHELAGLTDYQIDRILFHRRNKEGGLIAPAMPEAAPEPPTRESRLRTIDQLEAARLITPQKAAELRKQVPPDELDGRNAGPA